MFNFKLHDPKATWRSDPPTEFQLARLSELGVQSAPAITKGQAADLISEQSEPNTEETAFLDFFGVRDAANLNQLVARRKIADIISDPKNAVKWANTHQ